MRLWHLIVAVAVASVVLSIARKPTARVFLIVFVTGLGEAVAATAALMTLFQTLGALGEAKDVVGRVTAVAATSVVLAVAAAVMAAWLAAGAWIVSVSI